MKAYFLIMIILLLSCDEINKIFNPSSDYIIEKTVKPSSDEQVFESGSDFKLVFPSNSLSGDLEVKVKKLSSAPEFSLDKMKLGANIFQISCNGAESISKTIKVYIKYDYSKVQLGKSPSESVKGLVYFNGLWKESNFQIIESSSQVVFYLDNLSSKNMKDEPLLQGDKEIVLGDGYTTTDEGQGDNLMKLLPRCEVTIYSDKFPNGIGAFKNLKLAEGLTYTINPFTFSGKNFSLDYNSHPNIDPSTVNPEVSFWFDYYKYNVTGSTESESHSTLKSFEISEYRNYHSSQIDWSDLQVKMKLSNITASYVSKNNDTLMYYLNKDDVKRSLDNFYFNFNHIWENKVYSQNKSDINVLILRFTK
ncbi:hypothetical protein MASR1M45_07090 [Candidatus Kapaibacterium sp.]